MNSGSNLKPRIKGDILITNENDFFCPGCNQVSIKIFLSHKASVPIIQCPTCGLDKAYPDEFNTEQITMHEMH